MKLNRAYAAYAAEMPDQHPETNIPADGYVAAEDYVDYFTPNLPMELAGEIFTAYGGSARDLAAIKRAMAIAFIRAANADEESWTTICALTYDTNRHEYYLSTLTPINDALGAEMAVRKLAASDSLLVGPGSQPVLAVNPKATNTEGSYQVSVAGTLRAEQVRTARLDGVTSLAAGDLAVSGSVGIGTAAGGGCRLRIEGGDTYRGGALAVTGLANLNGGLSVIGPTVLNGPLTAGPLAAESLQILGPVAAGAASLNGGLSVTGSTVLGGDLSVTGGATLGGDVTIGAGRLAFGAQARQMINLGREVFGIGVQTNTLYFRTAGNVAWYRQGTHDGSDLSAGAGGTAQMVIRDGNVAVGTADPGGNRLRVQGSATYLEGALTVTGPATLNGGLTVNGLATTGTLRVGGGTQIERFDDGTLGNATTSVPTARAVKAYVDAQVTQLNSQINQATTLITQLTEQMNRFRAIYDRHQHRYIHYTYRDITTVNVQNWGDTQPPTPA